MDDFIEGGGNISAQDFADGIPALEDRSDHQTGIDNSNQDFAESMPVPKLKVIFMHVSCQNQRLIFLAMWRKKISNMTRTLIHRLIFQ